MVVALSGSRANRRRAPLLPPLPCILYQSPLIFLCMAQATSTWRGGGFSESAQRCCLFVCQVERKLHEDKDDAGNIPFAPPGPLAPVPLPAAPSPGVGGDLRVLR